MNALVRARKQLPRVDVVRSVRTMAYAGGRTDRLVQDWFPALLSADMEIKSDLRLLRARSRQLCRDNAHFAGVLETYQENIVGWEEDGIRLQARNKGPDGLLLAPLNRHLEERWRQWGYADTASADGQECWGDLQRLYVSTMAQDGEVLWRLLPGFDNPFGFAVQFLDADQLDESYNVPAGPDRNEIVMGVEVNRWGRPVAYHVWQSHPSDFGKRRVRERVTADQIIHDFVRWRPGQKRGLPWFTPVLLASKMLDGYTEAEIVQARLAASAGGFFEMTGEDAQLLNTTVKPDSAENSESSDILVLDASPGLSRQLPPGLRFKEWNPTHPNGNYAGFQKAILRLIARGIGVSYATFAGDLEAVNYSSIRAGLLTERDAFRTTQRFTAERFNTRVYRNWLPVASLAGAVQLPTQNAADWIAAQWQFRGWPWVDPLNDIQAAEREIKLGLTSRTRLCAERGRDFEEVLLELAEEERLAAQYRVSVAGADTPAGPSAVEDGADGAPQPAPSTDPRKAMAVIR